MALGDFKEEEFTDEEKAALGEVGDSKKADGEGEGTGKTQEELDAEAQAKADAEAAEKAKAEEEGKSKTEETPPDPATQAVIDEQGGKLITENGKQYVVDEDGAKIPIERFKKIYWKEKTARQEKEETQTKFNLFKELGAEKYYEKYPDEKPADYKPAEEQPPAAEDFNAMVVNGGKYDGLTIGEVAKEDPVAATLMVNNYLETKRTAAETQRRQQEEGIRAKTEEGNRFKWERAKELFGKEKDYTEDEIKQVNQIYNDLGDWMRANKKLHYSLEDAHLLMNKDKIIKDAKIESAKAALKTATTKTVASIGGGDSSVGLTGFEAIMAMSEDALTKHIDKMSDKEFSKFCKDAPKALKEKYPLLTW
jgi:hypothetical protein